MVKLTWKIAFSTELKVQCNYKEADESYYY